MNCVVYVCEGVYEHIRCDAHTPVAERVKAPAPVGWTGPSASASGWGGVDVIDNDVTALRNVPRVFAFFI